MSNFLKISNDVKVGKDNLQIVVESGSLQLSSDLKANSIVELTTLSHTSSEFKVGSAVGNFTSCPPIFVYVEKNSNVLILKNNNSTDTLWAKTWITYTITYYTK